MSEFSDYLNQMIEERNLNVAQAARLCDIDATVLYRWLCGQSLPGNWRRLEGIAEKLRLTPHEAAVLEQTYRKGLFGETQSRCFDEILKTMRTLAEKRAEYKQDQGRGNGWRLPPVKCRETASGFQKLNSKMDIIKCVHDALAVLSVQEGQELCLKLCFLPEWLIMQLKQFENQAANRVDMLICTGSEEGVFKEAELKLKRMRQMIDLMLAKNPIHIYFYHSLDELGQMGQSWLVSDRFLIQFPADLSQGMVTQDPEWIAFFQRSFGQLREKSRQFCKCSKAVLDYLGEESQLVGLQGSSVDFMPCLSIGLTEEIVRKGILPGLPGREEVIAGILQYPNTASRVRQVYSYFTKEGLHKFMESGVVDLFPYKIYRPLPMGQRCEVLRNVIAFRERNTAFHYILLKEDFADLEGIGIEQRHSEGEGLHIYFNFEEGGKEEIFILDPDIKEEYARFFQYLKESSFVYSEGETLDYMKEVLVRYQKESFFR